MCRHYTTISANSGISAHLHGLNLHCRSSSADLLGRFEAIYGHLPPAQPGALDIDLQMGLVSGSSAPPAPTDLPVIYADDLISYHGDPPRLVIRLPKYALLTIDLARRQVDIQATRGCLEVYGAFEDVLIIGLTPLYRRLGLFPTHAFAARSPEGQAVLISGERGTGKTTTGLALLSAGWKLLSNDSPLLAVRGRQVQVLSYPGRLSAFDDSLARFEALKKFIPQNAGSEPREKRIFRAEEAFPAPWAVSGPVAAVYFPRLSPGLAHSRLVSVPPRIAMLELLPQTIDRWDRETIPQALALLEQLVEQARCWVLKLAPQVDDLPDLLAEGCRPAGANEDAG